VIGEAQAFLLEKAPEWMTPAGGQWRALVHNNYHPHCSNINLLWFLDKDKFPRVVTKLYREQPIISREFENLRRAHAKVPELVPKPLHFGMQWGFWALWMEGLPGERFQAGNRHSPALLQSVVQSLAWMHHALRDASDPLPGHRYTRVVTEPLRTVAEYGPLASVRTGCEALAQRISPEWIDQLPCIPQHGDLFASNILIHHKRPFIVDWESFGAIGLPFYDLFTFLLSLLRLGGDAPGTWNPALIRQIPSLIQLYAQALEFPVSMASTLLPLTLVNWFHLQWCDGRKEFAEIMYKTLENYFSHPDEWQRVFLGGAAA
jgi:hypothetical protein